MESTERRCLMLKILGLVFVITTDQITADGGWRMEKCGLKNRVLKKPYFKRKNEKDFSLK